MCASSGVPRLDQEAELSRRRYRRLDAGARAGERVEVHLGVVAVEAGLDAVDDVGVLAQAQAVARLEAERAPWADGDAQGVVGEGAGGALGVVEEGGLVDAHAVELEEVGEAQPRERAIFADQ